MKLTKLLLAAVLTVAFAAEAAEEDVKFAFDNYHKYAAQARQSLADPAQAEKAEAMRQLRRMYNSTPSRLHMFMTDMDAADVLRLLTDSGTFSDFDPVEAELIAANAFDAGYKNTDSDRGGIFIGDALKRIYIIADALRTGKISAGDVRQESIYRAIVHYGMLELNRSNRGQRFHASCFIIPTAAVNIYFALLDDMERAEAGKAGRLASEACDMLKTLGLQAYTQPLRRDATDADITSEERFRNHVWWVGGNALAYRSLLPVAAMYSSLPMTDVVAEVCRRSISTTSIETSDSSFWTEGFTADGAGWGHGRQCLVWGYPIDGISNALKILDILRGTPWAAKLSPENTDALMNFLRGSSWYYYKGYIPPCLDRNSYAWRPDSRHIPYRYMLSAILQRWLDSFTPGQQDELRRLAREVDRDSIVMEGEPDGRYTGTRWFFCNDDLIKNTPGCHVMVNMASRRVDGLESAAGMADGYNFYTADGLTLFQRSGNEYRPIMGAWDVTASPGVTAREGAGRLTPVTNWRGYCSRHNYAGAATDGSPDAAVAGFIFEKMDGSRKDDVNDRGNASGRNQVLYGVKAHKAHFITGDYFVALGAGVTNLDTVQPGNIRTTIDQTARTARVYLLNPDGTRRELTDGTATLGADRWLVQDAKFAYRVLPEFTPEAKVALETLPCDWVGRNASNKGKTDMPATADILRLWADHGHAPAGDTYGYVVYTGAGLPAAGLPFRVLRNDTTVQAVATPGRSLVQAVFYSASTLDADGMSISADGPVVMQITTGADGRRHITVDDPCRNRESVTITVDGEAVKIPFRP